VHNEEKQRERWIPGYLARKINKEAKGKCKASKASIANANLKTPFVFT